MAVANEITTLVLDGRRREIGLEPYRGGTSASTTSPDEVASRDAMAVLVECIHRLTTLAGDGFRARAMAA